MATSTNGNTNGCDEDEHVHDDDDDDDVNHKSSISLVTGNTSSKKKDAFLNNVTEDLEFVLQEKEEVVGNEMTSITSSAIPSDLLDNIDWILSIGIQLQSCTCKFQEFLLQQEKESKTTIILKQEGESKTDAMDKSQALPLPRMESIHQMAKKKKHTQLGSTSSSSFSSSDSDDGKGETPSDVDEVDDENEDTSKDTVKQLISSIDHDMADRSKPIGKKKRLYISKTNQVDNFMEKYKVVKRRMNEKHAEDHWIYRPLLEYSQNYSFPPIHSWPSPENITLPRLDELDSYYEDEYGDCILSSFPDWNPYEMNDISQERITSPYSSSFVHMSHNINRSSIEQSISQDTLMDTILNDMIQQAWNQAVHLMDTVLPCHLHFQAYTSSPEYSIVDSKCPIMNKTTMDDCNEMFIHMNIPCMPVKYIDLDGITWFQCQTCTSPPFLSENEWITHFYGDDHHINKMFHNHNNTIPKEEGGCGTKMLKKRQYDFVQKILAKEAMFTIDGILHVLLSQIKKMIQQRQLETSKPIRTLDWIDVIRIFEQTINKDKDNKDNWNEDQVYESLLVHPNLVPIPLNNHVITTAKVRLVERYEKFDLNLRCKDKSNTKKMKRKQLKIHVKPKSS